MGRDGGQVVSVLAFYSDDPSSNPAEVYSFYSVNCSKRTKIIEKLFCLEKIVVEVNQSPPSCQNLKIFNQIFGAFFVHRNAAK